MHVHVLHFESLSQKLLPPNFILLVTRWRSQILSVDSEICLSYTSIHFQNSVFIQIIVNYIEFCSIKITFSFMHMSYVDSVLFLVILKEVFIFQHFTYN